MCPAICSIECERLWRFSHIALGRDCGGHCLVGCHDCLHAFLQKGAWAIVVCFGSLALVGFLHLPVETIGTRFGGMPSGLPHIAVPHLQSILLLHLLSPAVTIAMLGAIESLFSAVVSDRMSHDRHNPNMELLGQGIANIFSPLYDGQPATGAIREPRRMCAPERKRPWRGWSKRSGSSR